MYKQIISPKEFNEIENKNGIYIFVSPTLCGLCDEHEKNIKSVIEPGNITKVYSNKEQDFMDINIDSLPTTRIYDNKLLVERCGVLFKHDIESLLENIPK